MKNPRHIGLTKKEIDLGCESFESMAAAKFRMEQLAAEELNKDMEAMMRKFDTGATRGTDRGKIDYDSFLSPAVLRRFGEYMLKHCVQEDGELRDPDNWKKGIPRDAYMKSGYRHFMDWWTSHTVMAPDEDAICALLFNAMGYLHELLKGREIGDDAEGDLPTGDSCAPADCDCECGKPSKYSAEIEFVSSRLPYLEEMGLRAVIDHDNLCVVLHNDRDCIAKKLPFYRLHEFDALANNMMGKNDKTL